VTARVIVSIRIAADPERVFAAFTKEIGLWWGDSPLFRLTPRSPGVLAFEQDTQGLRLVERLAGGRVFEVGRASVWEPPRRLVVGWRCATFGPEHATEVEVMFEPSAEGTRATVEHRGWDSVPAEHVARHGFPLTLFQQRLGETWRNGLGALARLVADRPGN
jgi:uncharacterized protein YndB with AHSA1/START domain